MICILFNLTISNEKPLQMTILTLVQEVICTTVKDNDNDNDDKTTHCTQKAT